jgi:hypothetical protein
MEFLEITLGTLGATLGGISAIVTGLVGYYGRLRLEAYKSELEATNNRLNHLAEASIHVSKTQFDTEFQIYQQVWKKLVTLRQRTLSMRPVADSIEPNESDEDRMRKRLSEFQSAYNSFIDTTEGEKPFYAPCVYKSLKEINLLCYEEAIDYQYSDQSAVREYWEKSKANSEKIVVAIDECCEEIRSRIDGLAIVE